MNRRVALLVVAVISGLVAGCAWPPKLPTVGRAEPSPPPHRVVEVGFAPYQPEPADPKAPPFAASAVVVVPPALEQYVYVHYDPRWHRTFRIHLGIYVRDRVVSIAERRFRRVRVVEGLRTVTALPDDASFILLPEIDSVTYRTPHWDVGDDARFESSMRLRILYSTRRDAETLYATGSARGPFGADGANTPDLARRALDEMLDELDRVLDETVGEL